MSGSDQQAVRRLYARVLAAWNERDAASMAACFEDAGSMVGFDGTQIDSRPMIEAHLAPIFADHPTAAYVARVRGVRLLAPTVAVLRAVAGMTPPARRS